MKKLYGIALKAMKAMKDNPSKKSYCENCFSMKVQKELYEEHINYNYYNGSSCSNVLFYLEDLGIIKILQGVANRRSGVYCDQLEIKLLNNPDGNKI